MKPSLVPGLSRCETVTVDRGRTIGFLGEGNRVYSTPSMVDDVEWACFRLLAEHLDEGESTVGIQVGVDHLGATPIGEDVRVEVRVESVDGRRVTLSAQVRDAVETVGLGRHTRFVIDVERHLARLAEKRSRL